MSTVSGRFWVAWIASTAILLLSCSDEDTEPTPPEVDSTPPSNVQSLAAQATATCQRHQIRKREGILPECHPGAGAANQQPTS